MVSSFMTSVQTFTLAFVTLERPALECEFTPMTNVGNFSSASSATTKRCQPWVALGDVLSYGKHLWSQVLRRHSQRSVVVPNLMERCSSSSNVKTHGV